jgi:hypothetical protein
MGISWNYLAELTVQHAGEKNQNSQSKHANATVQSKVPL